MPKMKFMTEQFFGSNGVENVSPTFAYFESSKILSFQSVRFFVDNVFSKPVEHSWTQFFEKTFFEATFRSTTALADIGWSAFNIFKMGHPRPLFHLFLSFQYSWQNVHIKFADDWIRTVELLCRKRPLYQLSQTTARPAFN